MAFAKVSAITLSAVVGTGVALPIAKCTTHQLCMGDTCSQYTKSSVACHQAVSNCSEKTINHFPHFSLELESEGVVKGSVFEDPSCQQHTGSIWVRERIGEPCTLEVVSWRPHRTASRYDGHGISRRQTPGDHVSREARAPGNPNGISGGTTPPTTPPTLTSPALSPLVDTASVSREGEISSSQQQAESTAQNSETSTQTTTPPPPSTSSSPVTTTTDNVPPPPLPPPTTSSTSSSSVVTSASTSVSSSGVVPTPTGGDKPTQTSGQVVPTQTTQSGSPTSKPTTANTGTPTTYTPTLPPTIEPPPPPPKPPKPDDDGTSTGLIAGLVAGGLVGLALIGAGIFFLCCRRSRIAGDCSDSREGSSHTATKVADAGLGMSTLQSTKGKPAPAPPLPLTTATAAATTATHTPPTIIFNGETGHYQPPPPSPPSSLLGLDTQQQTSQLAFAHLPSNASTMTAGGLSISQQVYGYVSGAAWAIAQRPLPLPPAPYPGHNPQSAEAIQSVRGGGVAISPENLIKMQMLGEGEFGAVFQGVLKEGVSWCPVAIKELKRDAPIDPSVFYREAALMMTLKHSNIVTFLGTTPSKPFSIVMELMPLGDLRMYLRKRKSTGRRTTVAERMWFAFQIARGMNYLTSRGIAHRDLAARNCMLGEPTNDSFGYPVLKVSDFGLSRETNENNYYRMGNAGKLPVAWMAPESLRTYMFSSATDVWSYAVTMWELFTDCDMSPYAGWNVPTLVADLEEGRRLEQPRNCPKILYDLMLECWAIEPTHRPSFSELACQTADMFIPYSDESLVRVVGPGGDVTFERQPQYESIDHRGVTSNGTYISSTSVGGYIMPQS
eukprot:comp23193_c0_seq1/m.37624 comp23193_c0_seq1/g.37624  ORF comp23193_c0_seq1/g.37624 comp23193_c0_seq1/m.37624 type:complete len:838 (-) comp23193_c0_seq1:497-3010(-)